jgi:osmoprotectant transport system ATP-binding protein
MLMDEPFGALDAITRARLQDELIGIQRKLHKTILFVTHDIEEALCLADRIIVMRAGQIVQFDTPLALLTQPSDDFVRQLTGADNALRHLSLMTVAMALEVGVPPEAVNNNLPPLRPGDDLRSALARLLGTDAEALPVQDDTGCTVGWVSLTSLRTLISREASGTFAANPRGS